MSRKFTTNLETASSIDGDNGISTDLAVRVSVPRIRSFLGKAMDPEADIIVSTLRKGSWIVEDYLRIKGLDIVHVSTRDVRPQDVRGKNVILFDDSVHTGGGLCSPSRVLKESGSLRIVCLAINDIAASRLSEEYGEEVPVEAMRRFDEYAVYGEDGLLKDTCQVYFYTYVIEPYIENLTIGYSPDYDTLSVLVRGGSRELLPRLVELAVGSVPGGGETLTVNEGVNSLRVSKNLDEEQFKEYLSTSGFTWESNNQKVRVTVSTYSDYSEIAFTPIIDPIVHMTESDPSWFRDIIGDTVSRIIADIRVGIEVSLSDAGFEVIDSKIIRGIRGSAEAMHDRSRVGTPGCSRFHEPCNESERCL